MRIAPFFAGKRAVILGTGPGLTSDVVDIVRSYRRAHDDVRVFGINNTFMLPLFIDVFFACNPEWWDHYANHERMQQRFESGIDMWTWDPSTAARHGIKWIPGFWSGGKRNVTSLSADPDFIHYGHGSGYEVLGIAYHYGCREFILCGYDLRYGSGYDPARRKTGGPRHFFGEYPPELEHWPRVGPNGEMTGLLDCYRTIDTEALGLRIINTTPGTALDFFEVADLEKALHENDQPPLPVD